MHAKEIGLRIMNPESNRPPLDQKIEDQTHRAYCGRHDDKELINRVSTFTMCVPASRTPHSPKLMPILHDTP